MQLTVGFSRRQKPTVRNALTVVDTGFSDIFTEIRGARQAPARPIELQATYRMNHKKRYNKVVSPPQSWGYRLVGLSTDGIGWSA